MFVEQDIPRRQRNRARHDQRNRARHDQRNRARHDQQQQARAHRCRVRHKLRRAAAVRVPPRRRETDDQALRLGRPFPLTVVLVRRRKVVDAQRAPVGRLVAVAPPGRRRRASERVKRQRRQLRAVGTGAHVLDPLRLSARQVDDDVVGAQVKHHAPRQREQRLSGRLKSGGQRCSDARVGRREHRRHARAGRAAAVGAAAHGARARLRLAQERGEPAVLRGGLTIVVVAGSSVVVAGGSTPAEEAPPAAPPVSSESTRRSGWSRLRFFSTTAPLPSPAEARPSLSEAMPAQAGARALASAGSMTCAPAAGLLSAATTQPGSATPAACAARGWLLAALLCTRPGARVIEAR